MTAFAKRTSILGLGIVVCVVLVLIAYWSLQRNEVVRAAQSGLNAQFNTHVDIREVKLDTVGSFSKWVILAFRKHDWFVIYEVPHQGNATSMAGVGQNESRQWVYERTVPSSF